MVLIVVFSIASNFLSFFVCVSWFTLLLLVFRIKNTLRLLKSPEESMFPFRESSYGHLSLS